MTNGLVVFSFGWGGGGGVYCKAPSILRFYMRTYANSWTRSLSKYTSFDVVRESGRQTHVSFTFISFTFIRRSCALKTSKYFWTLLNQSWAVSYPLTHKRLSIRESVVVAVSAILLLFRLFSFVFYFDTTAQDRAATLLISAKQI